MAAHSTSIVTSHASSPAQHTPVPPRLLAAIAAFWREFLKTAFKTYRPEQHYMRGRGPAWHAKHAQPRTDDPINF